MRRIIDMDTCFAVIEPSDQGTPYITLFRDDDGVAKSFPIDCSVEKLQRLAFAIEAAIIEWEESSGKKVVDTETDLG